MKTILFLDSGNKKANDEYQAALTVTPDEIITWTGNHTDLPEDYHISALPCLVVDPEGDVEEVTKTDPVTKAEVKREVPMQIQKFEHRRNQAKLKTKVNAIKARVKAKK